MSRMRLRSTACSTYSRTSIDPSSPRPTRSTRTRSRPRGSPFRPLYDDRIHFSGQPVALVVAEEFEIARFAASLVRVEYEQEAHVTDFEAQRERADGLEAGGRSGAHDARPARARHSSRRPCGSRRNTACRSSITIRWRHSRRRRSGRATAGSPSSTRRRDRRTARNYVADVLGMPRDKVRVLSPFVGGAFGAGLRPQYRAAARRAGGAARSSARCG